MSFKIALIQMNVVGGEKQTNLDHAQQLVAQAASNGAALVVLPEALDLGWTHPSSQAEAEPIPHGSTCDFFSNLAKEHKIYLCTGLTEADEERVFNSAIIIDPQGTVLCKHRKLNELEIGHEYYDQGDRLQVVDTELGTLGLMICADGFAEDEGDYPIAGLYGSRHYSLTLRLGR